MKGYHEWFTMSPLQMKLRGCGYFIKDASSESYFFVLCFMEQKELYSMCFCIHCLQSDSNIERSNQDASQQQIMKKKPASLPLLALPMQHK
jgi:hypothetical protein